MKLHSIFFSTAMILLSASTAAAQITHEAVPTDTERTVEIILLNNTRHIGNVMSATDDELELRTESGRIFIELGNIKSIREVDLTKRGDLWFENPNKSRLFFSSTARPLAKGTGYYQNIYVFFNNLACAVTDNIAITGGFSLVPGLGHGNQLYLISEK